MESFSDWIFDVKERIRYKKQIVKILELNLTILEKYAPPVSKGEK